MTLWPLFYINCSNTPDYDHHPIMWTTEYKNTHSFSYHILNSIITSHNNQKLSWKKIWCILLGTTSLQYTQHAPTYECNCTFSAILLYSFINHIIYRCPLSTPPTDLTINELLSYAHLLNI